MYFVITAQCMNFILYFLLFCVTLVKVWIKDFVTLPKKFGECTTQNKTIILELIKITDNDKNNKLIFVAIYPPLNLIIKSEMQHTLPH